MSLDTNYGCLPRPRVHHRKGIDKAVDAYNARQPEEKEPEKIVHKSTSNHQELREAMSQKYSSKSAPSVQMVKR